MITFKKKSFVVEVELGWEPEEAYTNTVDELITLIQRQDDDQIDKYYFVLELLRAMIPDHKSLRALNTKI